MKEQADSFKAVPWALDLRSKEEVKKTLDDEADSFNAVGMQLLRDGKNRAARPVNSSTSELAKESIYIHRGRKMSYVSTQDALGVNAMKMQIITTTQEKAQAKTRCTS